MKTILLILIVMPLSLKGQFSLLYKTSASNPIPTPEVAYWSFDGNTDDVVGGNDANNFGATLTTDKGGNSNSAYLFNGSDYMDLSVTLNLGTTHSITMRVNMSKFVAMFPRNSTNSSYSYFISTTSYRYLAGGSLVIFTIPALSTGVYYDFAIVRSGTTVKFYVDGTQQGGDLTLGANNAFTMDQLSANASWLFGGVMDNIRIYNRPITQEEITAISNEP